MAMRAEGQSVRPVTGKRIHKRKEMRKWMRAGLGDEQAPVGSQHMIPNNRFDRIVNERKRRTVNMGCCNRIYTHNC